MVGDRTWAALCTSKPSGCETKPLVSEGSSGSAVRDVQLLLNAKANTNLVVDGEYGSNTREAVTEFQRDHNLIVDGMVGDQTWAVLCTSKRSGCVTKPRLSEGSSGSAVRDVQLLLNVKANANLAVDGEYGRNTKDAVTKFQRDHTLIADGAVGDQTWGALCTPKRSGCVTKPRLSEGSSGSAVRDVQVLLNEKRFAGLAVDGEYGRITKDAVSMFQLDYMLLTNGIVDDKTWDTLCSSLLPD